MAPMLFSNHCRRRRRLKLLLLLCAWLPLSVNAAIIPLFANLDGAQEVPPRDTAGFGHADLLLNDETNELSWIITFQGMVTPVVGAHFHEAPAGVNGPIVIPIGDLESPSIGAATVTDGFEAALLAGNVYINIHTELFPGGEIRGQVLAVPLPSTVALLGLSLVALGVFSTRRRSPS